MLKDAVNWYSFYINNWNPMILRSDAKEEKQNNNPNDPKLESMPKTRRNIKTKYYNPDPHPSRKSMYEFNDLKS